MKAKQKQSRKAAKLDLASQRLVKDAIVRIVHTSKNAAKLDGLLASDDPKTREVRETLAGLLVDLSNESTTYYDAPGVASALYNRAIIKSEQMEAPRPTLANVLRHLDLLINNPTAKNARAIEASGRLWPPR